MPVRSTNLRTLAVAFAALTLPAAAPSCASHATAPAAPPIMFRGDPAHTGVYTDPGPAAGAVVRWRYQADGTVRSSPAVTGRLVYVGTAGALLALDRADGTVRWRYDAGSPLPSSPAVADGVVVIGARDGSIHAVDAATGARRWSTPPVKALPLPWGKEGWDYWVSSPVVVGDTVLMGTPDGRLTAFDLESGDVRWSADLGARTRSSPAVADGIVYIGDDAGIVHAVRLADGREVWRHETIGAGLSSAESGWDPVSLQASPAVADGRVFIGSRDGGVYALDARTGKRLWYTDYGAPWVVTSAAVRGDRLWIGSSDGHFVAALDAKTGKELWRTGLGARVFASPTLAGRTLYVADHDGHVRALDPETGARRWSFDAGRGVMIQSSPVPADSTLYFGTDDGSVYALTASPAPPRLAVFWDSARADQAFRARHARVLRDYLADHGYTVLDDDSLGPWLQARIDDHAPSVVVFALDLLPVSLSGADPAPDLVVRYLRAGGKVVWTGFPPGALVRDSTGRPTGLDYAITERRFGLDVSHSGEGEYGATRTAEGRAWGLDGMHLAETAVAPGPHVTTLAVDELGRAAAVVRDYGGPTGTGLVLLWGTGADWDRLDEIRAAAEYGVLRRP